MYRAPIKCCCCCVAGSSAVLTINLGAAILVPLVSLLILGLVVFSVVRLFKNERRLKLEKMN